MRRGGRRGVALAIACALVLLGGPRAPGGAQGTPPATPGGALADR